MIGEHRSDSPTDAQTEDAAQGATTSASSSSDSFTAAQASAQARAHRQQAIAFAEQGKTDKALRHFHAALRLQPNEAAAYCDLGVALVRGGLTETALDYFRTALELEPGQATAANNLAWILATHPDEEVRNGKESLRVAKALCNEGKTDAQRLDTLAAAYAELGQFDDANRTARKAIELAASSGAANVHDIIARQQLYAARKPYRSPSAETLSAMSPATSAKQARGPAPVPEAEIVRSVKDYVRTLADEPEKWNTAGRVAWVLATHPDERFRGGGLALKITECLCEATNNRRPEFLTVHAAALAEQGQFEEAADACQLALELPNVEAELRTRIAEHHKSYSNSQPVRDSTAALEDLPAEDAGGLAWKMACIHLGLSQVFQTDGDVPSAISALRQCLMFSPRYSAAHRRLAKLLRAANKRELGVAHLLAAVQVCPEDIQLRHMLAVALADIGKCDDAIQQLSEVRRREPNRPGLDEDLALVLFRAGRTREAIEYCRGVVKGRPDATQIANNLAWILATHKDDSLRNGAEAVQLAERTCEQSQHRDPRLLDTLAAAYAETGRFDDAARTAEKGIELLGDSDQAADAVKALRERLQEYRAKRPVRAE